MDLKKEFDSFLLEEGSYVLVIRANKKIRCGCWNSSPLRTCNVCLGTGNVNIIKRQIAYEQVASVPETLGRLIRSIEPSKVGIEARHFFFNSDLQIEIGDIVVSCLFKNRKPIPPMDFYPISHIAAPKIKNVPQYIKASTSLDPINSNVRGFNLRRIGDSVNYDPIQ
jgi:hypothetical protein